MSHARLLPLAEFNARYRRLRAVPVAFITTLVFLTSVAVVLNPRPAGADQIGDLSQQAAALSQKLVQEQLQVDAEQQQYSVATAQVEADARSIARLTDRIDRDQALIAQRSKRIRRQAILDYVNQGAQASGIVTVLFTGNSEQVQAASEYDHIAVGNITTALDELRNARKALQDDQSAMVGREARDRANQATRASALGQATATAQELQAEQAKVTGQLAVAVADQASARRKAAAGALAAARHSSPTPSGAPSGAGTGPAPVSTTQGPPAGGRPDVPDPALNPYLQCVVRVESGGDYGAVSPNGLYRGAFQFSRATWNVAAQAAGLGYLVGVPPNLCTKAEQDTVAVTLYALDGEQPWLGDRCSS